MDITEYADVVLREEDFSRGSTPNNFIIAAQSKFTECEKSGEKYGVIVRMDREYFCDITEKFFGWHNNPDSDFPSLFYLLVKTSKHCDREEVLLLHMEEGYTTVVATLFENTWLLTPKVAIKWLESFKNIKQAVGISDEDYKRFKEDLENEINKQKGN